MPTGFLVILLLFFIPFGLLIIGFIALVVTLIMKGKAQAYKGIITDKFHNVKDKEDSRTLKEHFYGICVHLDSGKDVKIGLSREMCDGFSVGDRIEKKKGELWPKKIS